MPELPEVEVSRLGISPHLTGQVLKQIVVRNRQLRWPIPEAVMAISEQPILAVRRRAKYLLIDLPTGTVLLHLGMSGHLKVVAADTPIKKHDHVDFCLNNGKVLRFNDTRRFGAVLWQDVNAVHPLLAKLGPEPLSDFFDTDYLWAQFQTRQCAIKLALMDNHIVVGVGNIYANEVLFKAQIHPLLPAKQLTFLQVQRLVEQVRLTLTQAIVQGGTTLRDFSQADGKPGYFKQELQVYGRGNQPCLRCQTKLVEMRLGQRSTVCCPSCQPLSNP